LEVELKAQLLDARRQAQALIQEAELEVDRLYRDALALAQAEANATKEQSRVKMEAQKAEAFAGIDTQATKLGTLIVDRLLAA
jgi:F-type H+-transporting ATPase subunit b